MSDGVDVRWGGLGSCVDDTFIGWVQKAYREANVVDDEFSEEREKSMKSSIYRLFR